MSYFKEEHTERIVPLSSGKLILINANRDAKDCLTHTISSWKNYEPSATQSKARRGLLFSFNIIITLGERENASRNARLPGNAPGNSANLTDPEFAVLAHGVKINMS